MTSFINFLPGNIRVTLLSTSLVCLTYYSLNISTTTQIPYLFLLNSINAISISAYVPLLSAELLGWFASLVRSQVFSNKKRNTRGSIFGTWMYNSEFLLFLCIVQFAFSIGFISFSLLSLYTISLTSSFSFPISIPPERTPEPSRIVLVQPVASPRLGIDDFIPLLYGITHLLILSAQLFSFTLLIVEIRGSPRSSSIDRSLAGLLERDITELINLREEARLMRTSLSSGSLSRWNDGKTNDHGSTGTYTPYSPIRFIDGDDGNTPRRRSRTASSAYSTSNSTLTTPSTVPLTRQLMVDNQDQSPYRISNEDTRFNDPFTPRNTSNTPNSSRNNRRLSVRFDLSRKLSDPKSPLTTTFQKPLYTPTNLYGATTCHSKEEAQGDYFSLPVIPNDNENEFIRPIPLSIVRSPKDSVSGFSPLSTGSDTLENIAEEIEYNENVHKAWMDIKGDETV
ncbi:uncharacterized protein IL334_006004 [Kwoniella shivajii]|uniref:Uncharacterized protein n=1 Tax=Kwoniella shivajii TaxID=564305 RepID=A0ABZ1D4Q0_9TREE|nr:hypothetical protein IL334_006004 [Kwoniella shivajii]